MSSPDGDLLEALADAQEAVVNAVVAARRGGRRELWNRAVSASAQVLADNGHADAAAALYKFRPEFPE